MTIFANYIPEDNDNSWLLSDNNDNYDCDNAQVIISSSSIPCQLHPLRWNGKLDINAVEEGEVGGWKLKWYVTKKNRKERNENEMERENNFADN